MHSCAARLLGEVILHFGLSAADGILQSVVILDRPLNGFVVDLETERLERLHGRKAQ
jgi:hypothetical protein